MVGSGHILAGGICPQVANIVALNPPPAIGSQYRPPGGRLNLGNGLDTMTHAQFAELVVFYNEHFEVVAGDDMALRRQKFRYWLTQN